MNLPHQAPLLFAKEVLLKEEKKVEVLCIFPQMPTLAMCIEAAAQSSAAFNVEEEAKVGFLTMATSIKCLSPLNELAYIFTITSESEVGSYKKFFFVASDKKTQTKRAQGNFTLTIPQ